MFFSHKAACMACIPLGPRPQDLPSKALPPPLQDRHSVLQRSSILSPPLEFTGLFSSQLQKDPGILNLSHGYALDALPKEGKRKGDWDWGIATESTLRHAETLLQESRPSSSQHLSLYRAFQRWRERSPLVWNAPLGQLAAVFGTYLLDVGLRANTCASYTRTILKFLHREALVMPPQWNVAEDLLRALDLKAAAEPPEHAPDISEERAAAIIDAIEQQDVAFAVWAMCMSGARAADLMRLGSGQFRVSADGKAIAVDFFVTKNVRSPHERYSICLQSEDREATRHAVSFPTWIPFKESWRPFLYQDRPFIRPEMNKPDLSPPYLANRINYVLDHLTIEPKVEETSYSFRRLFINRVIDRFTEDGVTMWCKVIEITGHKRKENVKASYKIPATSRL